MLKYLILVLTLGLLVACNSGQPPPSTPARKTANPPVRTLVSTVASPSSLLNNTSTPSPSISPTPVSPLATVLLPTSTPLLYTVLPNDTLTGIARKFNITLEELLAANPSIGSQALTVGIVLTIPANKQTSSGLTATPVPVSIQQTQCYSNQDGSLWCLALIKNEFTEAIQNLTVLISLQDSSGKLFTSQPAYAPMDLLPSGKSIAIGAFFPGPIPDGYRSQVDLLSASLLASTNSNYPPIHFQNNLIQVDWGGLSARVSGQVVLYPQSGDSSRVWILAVAYDTSGNVVGFRRWESNNPLTPADILSFDFLIASLGAEIDHVELLVEAAK